jgi:tetratricopeptide (TPR) repeat protein
MATETPVASQVRVIRLTFGQLWQVPILLFGVLVLLGVAVARPFWYDPDRIVVRRELSAAREALERKSPISSELPVHLAKALAHLDGLPGRTGEAHFLMGSAYVRLAEQGSGAAVAENWQQARDHLEQALKADVPGTDTARLLYRLAKALSHTNGDMRAVAGYLERSIEDGAGDKSEGYELLTQAYLLENPPDYGSALKANETLLQLPKLDETTLAKAQLVQGQLLLRQNDLPNARKALHRIGANAPPSILAQAHYLLALSYQQASEWEQAKPLWQKLAVQPSRARGNLGHIYYYLGVCFANLKQPREAVHAWEDAEKSGGEEGQAATLRLAASRAESGDASGALELYRRGLHQVATPEEYCNDLVPLTELRDLLRAGCEGALKAKEFPTAVQFVHIYQRLAPSAEGNALLARLALAWAITARAQAARAPTPAEAKDRQQESGRHFHEAGEAFVAAAAKAAGADRSNFLWRAADAYEQGAHLEDAVSILIELKGLGNRAGEAWYRLGRAYQSLHQDEDARQAYRKCIERDTRPFVFRARYQLATLEARDHPDDAEKQLKQNLELMSVDPDPEAQEESLFARADLLYRLGLRDNYQQAIHLYDQALRSYPEHSSALRAQYHLGRCYLAQAQHDLPFLRPDQPHDAQNRVRIQRDEYLKNAVKLFEGVRDVLEKAAVGGTDRADPVLLRDTYFALAECRFVGEKYDDAIQLDDKIAHAYVGTLEEILALKHICECQIQLTQRDPGQLERAYATWQAISDKLPQLGDDAFVGRPVSQSRAELEAWVRNTKSFLESVRVTH